MGWKRIAGYGFILWLVPFLVAFVLFGVRQSNRALFESLITVTGVACAVAASLLFFRNIREAGLVPGLEVGFAWAAISVLIDLPIFLNVFDMLLPQYAADIALIYLAFPLITTGIAVAMDSARNAAPKNLFVAGSIRVAVSNAPELGGFLRQRRKNATQFRFVHILAQRGRNILDRSAWRKVMIAAKRPGFFSHEVATFETTFRHICIPIRNKDRSQHRWKDIGEAHRVANVKPTVEDLENALHHRVSLVARGKPGRFDRVAQEPFKFRRCKLIFNGHRHNRPQIFA